MNRRQRDQNRENALRLAVVVSEHALYPEYPNHVLEPAALTTEVVAAFTQGGTDAVYQA